jgi:elongation factor P
MADDIQATALRRGTAIIHEGVPYRVLEFEHRTPGNKRGFVQTKIRNLLDGTQREVKFSTNDSVERAIIEAREMDYLYPESDGGGLQLPKAVEIGIKETEPVIKGQTAAKSNKPAVLENGVTVQVPTFLGSGDRIRVDPGELRYIERAK